MVEYKAAGIGFYGDGTPYPASMFYSYGHNGSYWVYSNGLRGFGRIQWLLFWGGDPMFVDIANGDFHLRMGATCINTGSGWWGSFSTDFDGNPRFVRGATDIGPYEFQPTNETQTITAPIPVEFSWIDEK